MLFHRTSALLAFLFLCSSAALSQDNPRRPGGERPEGRGRPGLPGAGQGGARLGMLPIMKALDADQDGTLSAAEIQNASKALAALDKNSDGMLSAEEMRPDPSMMARPGQPGAAGTPGQPGQPGRPGAGGAPTGEMLTRMFDARDTDKDGKLSGDEIPERMRENVSRVDTMATALSIAKKCRRPWPAWQNRPDSSEETVAIVAPKAAKVLSPNAPPKNNSGFRICHSDSP